MDNPYDMSVEARLERLERRPFGLLESSVVSSDNSGWEILGRDSAETETDLLTVSFDEPPKYLRIIFAIQATGGTISSQMRFNDDSGNNYAQNYIINFGVNTNIVSQNTLYLSPAASVSAVYSSTEIINYRNQRKTFFTHSVDDNAANATSSSNHIQVFGKWSNTTEPIGKVTLANGGTGSYAIGSELTVLGLRQ